MSLLKLFWCILNKEIKSENEDCNWQLISHWKSFSQFYSVEFNHADEKFRNIFRNNCYGRTRDHGLGTPGPDSPGQALRESSVRRIYRYDGYSLANICTRPGSSSGILDFPGKNYIGYFQYINQSSVIELHQGLWKHCQSDPGFATQCSGYSDSNLELVSTVLSVRQYNVDGLT